MRLGLWWRERDATFTSPQKIYMPWNFPASVGIFSSRVETLTHDSSWTKDGVCYLQLNQLDNFSLALWFPATTNISLPLNSSVSFLVLSRQLHLQLALQRFMDHCSDFLHQTPHLSCTIISFLLFQWCLKVVSQLSGPPLFTKLATLPTTGKFIVSALHVAKYQNASINIGLIGWVK